jgi:pSer/pThr/pTyr-binding forkhead associated (FHA) protein
MAKLIVMLRDKVLKEVQIGPQGVKVGREAENDIQLENPAVSRCHAEIYRQDYPFYVEDKKSTNGTYLNGAFVTWKAALSHNDKITIGKHTLVFIEEAKDHPEKKKVNANETLYLSPEDLERLRNS